MTGAWMPLAKAIACAMSVTPAIAVPSGAHAESTPPAAIAGEYIGDTFANLSGGKRTGVRAMGKLIVTADADLSALAEGATVHVDLQYVHGQSLSGDLVGDGQVVSNIDAPSGVRPMEAYVALPFGADGAGTLKAGLIDLNADFDVQAVGAFFLNSAHGIGSDFSQTGRNGPSIFPTAATAFTVEWRGAGWTGRLGAFDAVAGDPDRPRRTVVRFPGETGLLIVGEADIALDDATSLQVGGWQYTPRFDRLDVPDRRGTSRGAYGMVEGTLARRGEAELGAWLRVGMASDAVNPIGIYAGGGASYGTDAERVGLALAHARLGDPARAAALASGPLPRRAETTIELSYARQVHERIVLQPDVQYVVNPGWDQALADALVAGLRVTVTLF